MLNRQEKEAVVASLQEKFAQSQGSFFIRVQGLTVEQLQNLRGLVRQKGGSIQVAKVRLVKRALLNSEEESDLLPYIKEQIAVVFFQEPLSIAKTLSDFAQNNQKLLLVAGRVESALVDAAEIKALGALPPREVLLGQLIAAVQSPLSGLVFVLGQVVEQSEKATEQPTEQVEEMS